MKNDQNLMLFFAAILALLVAYVFALLRLPGEPTILSVAVAGLGTATLALAGSDLLENHRKKH